jgi:hypothetical protein
MFDRVTVGLVAAHDQSVGWTVEIEGVDPARERARSALLTLGDGVVGTTAVLPSDNEAGGVVAAGIYDGTGPEAALMPLPRWNHAPLAGAVTLRRVLDLRDGTLRSELDTPAGEASTLSFASLARPGTAVLVTEGPGFGDRSARPLSLPVGAEHGCEDGRWWARVQGSGGASAAASERVVRVAGARLRLERLVAYATDARQAPRPKRPSRPSKPPNGSGSRHCSPSSAPSGRGAGRRRTSASRATPSCNGLSASAFSS